MKNNSRGKPGPKPKANKIKRSVDFDADLVAAVEAMADSHPLRPSVPAIINLALRKFLESEGQIQPIKQLNS